MSDDTKGTTERVVFVEEGANARIKLIACGPIDELTLDGLGAYIGRQRRRLTADAVPQFPDEGIA